MPELENIHHQGADMGICFSYEVGVKTKKAPKDLNKMVWHLSAASE